MTERYIFDSNAIDPIADNAGAYEVVRASVDSGSIELMFTHVNIDELTAIKDPERRAWLVLLLVDIGRLVPTGTTALGFSRPNFCRVGSEYDAEFWDAMRSSNVTHTRDALIASTAKVERARLLTNETRLTKRALEWGIEVLTTRQLLEDLDFNY
jgi:hypothetical protein